VGGHALAELALNHREMLDPVPQKHRAEHGHIRARQQQLERVDSPMHSARRGQAGAHATVQHGNPAQRQADFAGRAQVEIRDHLHRLEGW
jgi:hypothetical protein